jgi:peroxiredoxin
MEMTADGPASVGIMGRSKRWAMLVDHNIVKGVAIAESELDPAGDAFPEKTLTAALMEMVKEADA